MIKKRLEIAKQSRKLLVQDGFLWLGRKKGFLNREEAERFLQDREKVHTFSGKRRNK